MVHPSLLCNKHLLGEHVEHHMFIGTIRKGISINGYILNGLVEPDQIVARHDVLATEMEKRGMNHKTPIQTEDLIMMRDYNIKHPTIQRVNADYNLNDLKTRCERCRANILKGNN